MRKIFRRIHLWLSVPVGLVFCMLCLTGAILVFETEITDAYYSPSRHLETVGTSPLPEDALMAAATRSLGADREIRGLRPSGKPDEAWKLSFATPRGSAVFINPYTGEITGDAGRLAFFSTVCSLHRWLLDAPREGGSTGRRVVGWCTLASFFIVVSGFVLWLPGGVARLKINCSNVRAFLYTLHTAVGFWTLLILLVVILTGLTWSFGWWHDIATAVTGDIHYGAIHTGSWLGLTGKVLWFVTALGGASLPLTGYYIWLRRSRKRG